MRMAAEGSQNGIRWCSGRCKRSTAKGPGGTVVARAGNAVNAGPQDLGFSQDSGRSLRLRSNRDKRPWICGPLLKQDPHFWDFATLCRAADGERQVLEEAHGVLAWGISRHALLMW